jgi:hypothetical protein
MTGVGWKKRRDRDDSATELRRITQCSCGMRIALAVAVMMAGGAAETWAAAETGADGTPAATKTGPDGTRTATETAVSAAAGAGGVAAATRAGAKTRCTAREVRAAVKGFVAELNRGDLRALDRRFSPASRFEWYSTPAPGERFGEAAKDRSTLIPYFKERHARHERLTLRRFDYNGASAARYGNFEYTLTRRADDLRRPTRYEGKGAAWCFKAAPDEIFVWSMGRAG